MGLFRHVVYGTGVIMVAEPASRIVVAGINAMSDASKSETKSFNEGYKKGFSDAVEVLKSERRSK